MNEWQANFSVAESLYRTAIYSGTISSPEGRLQAAIEFADWILRFKEGGTPALNVIEEKLLTRDVYSTAVAARLCITSASPERVQQLSEQASHGNELQLPPDILKQLWTTALPSSATELFRIWVLRAVPERFSLLEALLSRATEPARSLFSEIVNSGHSKRRASGIANTILGSNAVRIVAGWNDHDLLRNIVENPPLDPSQLVEWYDTDLSVDAALYLGLAGDKSAVSFLEAVAYGGNAFQAARACRALAWLCQPTTIKPVRTLLEHEDGNIVWIVLGCAATLSCGALMTSLLQLAERKIYADRLHIPLCDEAIRVVRSMLEPELCEPLQEEYETDSIETFTDGFRREAIAYYMESLSRVDEKRRYRGGSPLRLKHLATDLLSVHTSVIQDGAYNLHAITGESYSFDYDPHSTLISNLHPILEWQKRAEHPEPLTSGGWAFQGIPLSDPDV
jgi:hypothetical protein